MSARWAGCPRRTSWTSRCSRAWTRRLTTAPTQPRARFGSGPRSARADKRRPEATRGSPDIGSPVPCTRLTLRSRRVVVAARELGVVALVERDRQLGVVPVYRIGMGVCALWVDRVDRAIVWCPGQPPQIPQPMPGRIEPERALAEQQVHPQAVFGRAARIGEGGEGEAAVVGRVGAQRVQTGDHPGTVADLQLCLGCYEPSL